MSVIVKDPSSKVNNLDLFVCDRKTVDLWISAS